MWEVRGTPASAILEGLSSAERIGALCESYKGGEFIVRLNNYKFGSIERLPIPTDWLSRWRIERGGGPFHWSWQANDSAGACCASTESTRERAVTEAKEWLDSRVHS